MRRMRGGAHFNIIGHAKRWFFLSGALVVLSLVSLFVQGINPGLEFSGGTALQAQASRNVTVEQVRQEVDDAGLEAASVQEVGNRGFLVQGEHLEPAEQEEATKALARILGVDSDEVNVTTIGPKWGAQITSKAVRALVIFLFFTVVYLSIRLEPKMAGATMVALIHDLVITAGVYSLSGFEVTPSTVIGLLTILGYSLYDSVVIFDRVKERTASLSAAGKLTYSAAANDALNQVLLRSFNTSIISLIPVGSLLFVGSFLLGAQTLRELALALFVGLAAGAYSSVFIATPILSLWKERESRWATLRQRIAARGEGATILTPPPPAPAPAAPAASYEPAAPTATAVAEPPAPQQTKKRPQQRRKKRKHGRR